MKEPLRMKCLRMYLFMIPGEHTRVSFGLDVDEDFRHQGLAGRLMKALIEKAE